MKPSRNICLPENLLQNILKKLKTVRSFITRHYKNSSICKAFIIAQPKRLRREQKHFRMNVSCVIRQMLFRSSIHLLKCVLSSPFHKFLDSTLMSYSPPSDYKMKIKSPASVVRSFVLISLIPDFALMFREIFT